MRSAAGRVRARRSDARAAVLFLAPFLAFYLAFLVYPFFLGLWISLHDWELVGDYREYIGFLNYQDMFADASFWRAFRNTLLFTAITVPAMVGLSLGLALGLNRETRLHAVLRAVFFVSNVFSVTVVTLVWVMVLNPDQGLFAHAVRALGLQPVAALSSTTLAMPALALTTVWWAVGFPMILFLAGLQSIPGELYEAARLDRASPWRQFTRITLPALRRTMLLVCILQVINQLQIFGQVLLMTGGGPADRTRSIVQSIYQTAFGEWQLGYASAMSTFLFAVMLAASLVQLFVARGEERE